MKMRMKRMRPTAMMRMEVETAMRTLTVDNTNEEISPAGLYW